MSKHNYSQYSNKKNETKINPAPEAEVEIQNGVDDTVTEETVVENKTVTDTDVIVETIENKSVVESNTGAVGKGVVANCTKLNVRSKPSKSADVVTVLDANDKITIDVDESTEDWFKICTAGGVKGYCMRKFVNANI